MSEAPAFRTALLILTVTAGALIAGGYIKAKYLKEDAPLAPSGKLELASAPPSVVAEKAVGRKLEGPYPFFDQNGKAFELSAWFDKPLVISYIFTECPMVCPTITQSLADFSKSGFLALGTDYRVVTVGFDPASDKPSAMKTFGSKFVSDFSNWRFVTGSPEVVRRLSEDIGIIFEPDDQGSWRHTMGVTVVAPGGVVSSQLFGMTFDLAELQEKLKQAAVGKKPKG